MNSFIPDFATEAVGLTSIGMDGEAIDNLTFLPKPRVTAHPGFLVATAEKCLDVCEAEYEIIEKTNLRTPLGQISIVKINKAGRVLIAGPSKINDMEIVVNKMLSLGSTKVFIDGAFSRRSSSKLATATILVIGANRSPVMETVLRDARIIVDKLTIKGVEKKLEHLNRCKQITAVDDKDNFHKYDGDSVITEPEKVFDWINPRWKYLYVPNAVGIVFLRLMVKDLSKKFILVMNDPASLQIDETLDKQIGALKDRLRVIRPVNLVAVCINPTSPRGYVFEEQIFHRELESRLNLKVINVLTKVGDDHEQTQS
ncbi:MAG: hypothetical protein GX904_00095 [Acholeplasmataceae bacterium]|nr:hypothetical protein [Acholeplasmataceae bacterium]